MEDIFNRAKKCFECNGTIQPVLDTLTSMTELMELKKLVKSKPSPFFRTARKEIKEFKKGFNQQLVLNTRIDLIELIVHGAQKQHDTLPPEMFHMLARALATGAIREIPSIWTGMVSKKAIANSSKLIKKSKRVTETTYIRSSLNSKEHFYNNLFAGYIILTYMLYYEYDRRILEDLCKVFRQVHITTSQENRLLAHNGQNDERGDGWKAQYVRNDIELINVGIKSGNILKLKDVVPMSLIKQAMDMRTTIRNLTRTSF